MKISTLRWAIASFLGGVAVLVLASIPLVALSIGVGSPAFRDTVVVAAVFSPVCALVIAVALDLLGARARAAADRRSSAAPARRQRRRARTAGAG